jgi:hypothetical protein
VDATRYLIRRSSSSCESGTPRRITPERVPEGHSLSLVRAYMAHHQGMILAAIGNAFCAGEAHTPICCILRGLIEKPIVDAVLITSAGR